MPGQSHPHVPTLSLRLGSPQIQDTLLLELEYSNAEPSFRWNLAGRVQDSGSGAKRKQYPSILCTRRVCAKRSASFSYWNLLKTRPQSPKPDTSLDTFLVSSSSTCFHHLRLERELPHCACLCLQPQGASGNSLVANEKITQLKEVLLLLKISLKLGVAWALNAWFRQTFVMPRLS